MMFAMPRIRRRPLVQRERLGAAARDRQLHPRERRGRPLRADRRQLGVSEQALMAAVQDHGGRHLDFAAAARALGVSEAALRAALPPPPPEESARWKRAIDRPKSSAREWRLRPRPPL